MKYKAICFDVDGTLYNEKTLKGIMTSFVVFRPNLNRKYGEMRKTFRQYQDNFESLGLANATMHEKEVAMMAKSAKVSINKAEKIVNRYYTILERVYKKLGREETSVRLFEELKTKGYLIGVFSDWPLYSKLEQLGVAGFVDFASSSVDCGKLKPSAYCFEDMMYNLKVKPSETLYVGDSYSKDILGAVAAGIDAVMVGTTDREKYGKAKEVFRTLEDFEKWILSLEEK